jgi:hypothetical protein
MSAGWLRPRWLFNRHVGLWLFWIALLLITAVAVNLLGIRLTGSIEDWERWMNDHAGYFLAWRLLLYTSTVWGWIWMRRRLLARESDRTARQRFRCLEVAAVAVFVTLEASVLLRFL